MRQIAETEPLIGEALDMERMFLMDRTDDIAVAHRIGVAYQWAIKPYIFFLLNAEGTNR